MTNDLWAAVDDYVADHLLPQDPVLNAALAASDAAGLPPGTITPAQGKLLELLAQVRGARSILELGTLGGYSTIWLARALPTDGQLVTLELDPHNAEVASANIANAGLAERVQIRIGPARETLPELHAEGATRAHRARRAGRGSLLYRAILRPWRAGDLLLAKAHWRLAGGVGSALIAH